MSPMTASWGAKAEDCLPRRDLGRLAMPTARSITPAREFATALQQGMAAVKYAAPNLIWINVISAPSGVVRVRVLIPGGDHVLGLLG